MPSKQFSPLHKLRLLELKHRTKKWLKDSNTKSSFIMSDTSNRSMEDVEYINKWIADTEEFHTYLAMRMANKLHKILKERGY